MIVAGLLIAVMMIVLGFVIKFARQYWLIAGYNTMPREKQKNVDIKGLSNFMGNWFFGLGTLVLAGLYLGIRFNAHFFNLAMLLFISGIACMVIKAQRFDKNVKREAEKKTLTVVLVVAVLIIMGVGALILYGSV